MFHILYYNLLSFFFLRFLQYLLFAGRQTCSRCCIVGGSSQTNCCTNRSYNNTCLTLQVKTLTIPNVVNNVYSTGSVAFNDNPFHAVCYIKINAVATQCKLSIVKLKRKNHHSSIMHYHGESNALKILITKNSELQKSVSPKVQLFIDNYRQWSLKKRHQYYSYD